MPRFKLTIEYAGTRYSGWQIQKNARTVQGEIDRAVRTVTGRKDFELYGSGRTDAGVHALGQVAHLDVATTLPAETLRRRLNDELPADINILAPTQVPHRFHARHDAVARRYLYQIARRRTAFAKAYVWWVKEPIDVARMREAADAFVGMRDFQSFAAVDDARRWRRAAAVDAGAGRSARHHRGRRSRARRRRRDRTSCGRWCGAWSVCWSRSAAGADRRAARFSRSVRRAGQLTAPPSGLFLERVYYEGDARDETRPRAANSGS